MEVYKSHTDWKQRKNKKNYALPGSCDRNQKLTLSLMDRRWGKCRTGAHGRGKRKGKKGMKGQSLPSNKGERKERIRNNLRFPARIRHIVGGWGGGGGGGGGGGELNEEEDEEV